MTGAWPRLVKVTSQGREGDGGIYRKILLFICIYMYIPCVCIYIYKIHICISTIFLFLISYSILFMSMNLDICIHTCYLSICGIH